MNWLLGIAAVAAFTVADTQAQTVLFRCDFDGGGSTASERWSRCGGSPSGGFVSAGTLVDGPWGKAAKISASGANGFYAVDASFPATREVTMIYQEKFDKWPISGANVKSVRAYYGDGYLGAVIGAWFNERWYQSAWDTAILETTPMVTQVNTEPNFCSALGGNSYRCRGADGIGRMSVSWSPGYGTSWHKIRMYIRMPSNQTTADGMIKVWIDDQLMYTLRDIDRKDDGGPNGTDKIRWFPSDEATDSFSHFLDEVVVYAGYVPPGGGDTSATVPPDVTNVRRSDTAEP